MRQQAPFRRSDLRELGDLLERADEVVAMREIAAGERDPMVIGLRHDVDNTLRPCLELAEWEHRHGWRATYFVLHDSPYWDAPALRPTLERIADMGHEIGIHTNALAVALQTGRHPDEVLASALGRLREWGHNVTGVVAHGDNECYERGGKVLRFVNDEHFTECARPELGAPDRVLVGNERELKLEPRSLHDFALRYESYRAGPRALYLSDSNGRWNTPGFRETARAFPTVDGQLHVLQHPCWWADAFPTVMEGVSA